MNISPDPPEVWPTSIREINNLPAPDKYAIYRTLITPWVYDRFGIDHETLTLDGQPVIHINCPENSRAMEFTILHQPHAQDPIAYLHMADTFNNQLLVLLIVANDPEAPRFAIDRDAHGHSTKLGTTGRNIPAEIAAMNAGLAPGQIRAGLRTFRAAVPAFEQFVSNMSHDMFMIEPLAYHNAITFERYGFNYLCGRQEMERIHQGFMPGGDLQRTLDGSTPFRMPDAWQTVRGRSWAIHDGILRHPFTGFQMYKRVGVDAGVNTFPDARW